LEKLEKSDAQRRDESTEQGQPNGMSKQLF
jgi:hypothetical protein